MNNKGILDINRLVFNDGTTQTTAYTGAPVGASVPIGAIFPFAGAGTIPTGYLLCDGSPLSSAINPALFAVIGQLYGTGGPGFDFNLPDMTSSFIKGSATTTGVKAGGSITISNANIALTTIQARNPTIAEGNPNSSVGVVFNSANGVSDWQYLKGQPSGDGSVSLWQPQTTDLGRDGGNLIDSFRVDIGQATPTPINPVPLSYSMVYIIKAV
jgi:microcystin-dependent protein